MTLHMSRPSFSSSRLVHLLATLLGLAAFALVAVAAQQLPRIIHPGPAEGGVTILPNGWKIAPAGRHVHVSDLPLNMIMTADGRYVIVTNDGYSKPTFSVVDTEASSVVTIVPLENAWLGLAWNPDGKHFYSSAENEVQEFTFDNGAVTFARAIPLGESPVKSPFAGGLCVRPDGGHLYVVRVLAQSLSSVDLGTGQVQKTVPLSAEPYTCMVSPDGRLVYVSLWGGAKVLVFDAETLAPAGEVTTGDHPNAMVLSRDGSKLYVACANTNSVWVIDVKSLRAIEQVSVSLFPDSPPGSTPNALALSPDGRTLLVANADNNTVAVVNTGYEPAGVPEAQEPRAQGQQASHSILKPEPGERSEPRRGVAEAVRARPSRGSTAEAASRSQQAPVSPTPDADAGPADVGRVSSVRGFIPTGWYPTCVAFSPDGGRIYVLSGKGLQSQANPQGPNPVAGTSNQYIATLLPGTLSVIDMPDEPALQRYTSKVYQLTPYSAATRFAPAGAPADSPIPREVGDASPIQYVFYIIRENRTYDQVLGDMAEGNGDASLCLFDEKVTPNAHAISRQFTLFDNMYVNAEVSYSGHAYSMGAYATDLVEKMWPANYGRRVGAYLGEGGGNMRGPYGNIAAPSAGYIWDACTRAGVSVRSYGEFVEEDRDAAIRGERIMKASVPGLEGRVDPDFPPFDLSIPDQQRADIWLKEFRQFEEDGNLPRLSIIRLPRDHTAGARAGQVSPVSMVADNDLALGRVVDAISHSRFWKESAIFVLEDDAQNGPDHVDAHRSVLLVASPFTRRKAVDSTLYTTCSVLRTMELILGLPPMTQLDAAAAPLYGAFRSTPDPTPFEAEKARVPLDQLNPPRGKLAEASAQLDLGEADLAADIPFNEIIWKAVRGEDSVMPPPKRAVFVRHVGGDRD
jgi:YVTN family beta-propeller protein